ESQVKQESIASKKEFDIPNDISKLIKEDATDVKTIIEPGFSESTDDDLSITSETKKIILEGLNSKANKFKEKQNEILATYPINAKQIQKHLEKNEDTNTSLLDEITSDAIYKKNNVDDSELIKENLDPIEILNNSRIYKSFKKMTT